MPTSPPRVIAIDWSGAASGAHRKIWLAEVRGGELVRIEAGRSRDEVRDHLIEEALRDPRMIVGFDFAFSFPAWFLEQRRLASAKELWALAGREAEVWLAACESPFWGRPGRGKPELPEHFRRTDRDVPNVGGVRPKSVFQIGGAGTVGTASLRGMPVLHRLADAGFRIWPFDAPGWPLVVEIYPRILTGQVVKSSRDDRAAFLARRYPSLGGDLLARAVSSDDAFDAAVSALVMAEHVESLSALPVTNDRQALLEGLIWYPSPGGGPGSGSSPMASIDTPVKMDRDLSTGYARLLDALSFAADKHRNQRRKDVAASPYINHPIRVAEILAGPGGVGDEAILMAAILHDTIEDTETTPDELEARFGLEIRRLVEEVTDDKRLPKDERKRLQVEHAPSLSVGAQQIKIADKIANISDVAYDAPDDWGFKRRRAYLDWTEDVVAGCRGCNPKLEQHYNRVLVECRASIVRQEKAAVEVALRDKVASTSA